MANPINFELGKCYEIVKIDNTKIAFNFWGDEPPYGKILNTGEKVLISSLLNGITNCYEINCPTQ
jgi:hypothetical protein